MTEFAQRLTPGLLLFQLLAPWIAAIVLSFPRFRVDRKTEWLVFLVHLLLAVSGLVLAGCVLFLSHSESVTVTVPIEFVVPLGNVSSTSSLLSHLVWELDSPAAFWMCLIPWIAISAQIFSTEMIATSSQITGHLWLTASLNLFIAAGDVGSLAVGAGATILFLAARIAWFGGDDKRNTAVQFLMLQLSGLMLMVAGLGLFVASASLIRSAPFGPPRPSSFSFPELESFLQTAITNHPAAEQLWGEYRVLPSALMLLGIMMMAAGFPMQVWLSESSASAALGERLWQLAWVKGVLFTGLRLLAALDPEALHSFGWWGLIISIPGAIFVSSLLFSQAYLSRMQSSCLAWTQQLGLIAAFTATQHLELWLVPLLFSQLAGMVLFTVALTTISERYRSVEMASFQGLSARAGWLLPVLATCMITFTLTPLGIGLIQGWLVSTTLQGTESLAGTLLRGGYFLANLLALGGLVRITHQLCTGPLRLPEMAPGLRERTQLPASIVTLQLSRGQLILLAAWGVLAVVMAVSGPIFYLSVNPNF